MVAEKATWVATPASSDDAQNAWQTEKAELIKARDDAVNNLKVSCTLVSLNEHRTNVGTECNGTCRKDCHTSQDVP